VPSSISTRLPLFLSLCEHLSAFADSSLFLSPRASLSPGGLVLPATSSPPLNGFGLSFGPEPPLTLTISKYTSHRLNRAYSTYPGIGVNYAGNHKKSLRTSLDASLKKLRTDYIDILYVHWWDHSTSIPELIQSLADVVREGKVLYLGVSDTPGEWLRGCVWHLACRTRRIGRIRWTCRVQGTGRPRWKRRTPRIRIVRQQC
jgi:hypothetical protein